MGLACFGLFLFNGRTLGVNGLLGGALTLGAMVLLVGIVVAGAATLLVYPAGFIIEIDRSLAATLIGGLLVGAGTQLGSGCTSGHGICGIGRLSVRSLVATVIFMTSGAVAVFVISSFFGGAI
ncbi:MAG: YeeE/YedE family protein [Paracoccaceae bacterium]|jgi:uncharacterized membrane protein YedE/YeeE